MTTMRTSTLLDIDGGGSMPKCMMAVADIRSSTHVVMKESNNLSLSGIMFVYCRSHSLFEVI